MSYLLGTINYKEGDQASYESITISAVDLKETFTFNSGNPTVDLIDCYEKINSISKNEGGIIWGAEYQNFLEDGDIWIQCIIDNETNKLYFEGTELINKYGVEGFLSNTTHFIIPNDNSIKTLVDLISYYNKVKNL